MFNGIIQNNFGGVFHETSRACTGMLSSENDDFKFLKTAKNKKHVHHESWNCFFSPNQSVIDQKHEHKSSHRAALYIFKNIEIYKLVTFH